MSKKENNNTEQEPKQPTAKAAKEMKRNAGTNKNVPQKLNETETGVRQSRGKKQRRQFKLAPNRG
jgi:hypothetical protein